MPTIIKRSTKGSALTHNEMDSNWQCVIDNQTGISARRETGWGNYADTVHTTGARLTISAGVRTKLPNNAGTVIETNLPTDGSSFYNGTTQLITPNNEGEAYMLRVNLSVDSSTLNNFLDVEIDIGVPAGVVLGYSLPLARSTNDKEFSTTTTLFAGATFITNGGEIYITPEDDIDIWDIAYFITKIA